MEHDLFDALADEKLRDGFPDLLGGVALGVVADGAADFLGERRRVGDRRPGDVVDHLRVDVLRAAKHGEARLLGRAADLPADAELTPLAPNALHRHDYLPP